jgi:tetratricopeptide (TPR) repeat protein
MLFDLQGKRKRLIQVVYALLALLLGGGLVLFGIGGDVSGGLFDAFSSRQSAQTGDLVKEAERLQERADEDPDNKQVLTRLIRARYTAGNSLFEIDDNGQPQITPEAREQFELAADTWRQYLDLNPDPVDANVAQLVANALFSLAQGATDGMSARMNSAAAADAQAYFAEARPSVGSLSTLAIYSYFGNDFEAGDEAVEKLLALNKSPAVKKRNKRQMDEYRKQAKQFQEQLDAYEKAMNSGSTDSEPAPPQILSPSGGLSGSTSP